MIATAHLAHPYTVAIVIVAIYMLNIAIGVAMMARRRGKNR